MLSPLRGSAPVRIEMKPVLDKNEMQRKQCFAKIIRLVRLKYGQVRDTGRAKADIGKVPRIRSYCCLFSSQISCEIVGLTFEYLCVALFRVPHNELCALCGTRNDATQRYSTYSEMCTRIAIPQELELKVRL